MPRIVQIKGDRPVFPINACVHCLRPATRDVEIVQVRGYAMRRIKAPFCDDCITLRQAKSRRQVMFERFATADSVLLALAVGAWSYVSVSSQPFLQGGQGRVWGLLLGVLVALIVFGLMYLIVVPWSRHFRSTGTKVVLKAVTIKEFDWETTTLEFGNEEYGERFAQMNPMPRE